MKVTIYGTGYVGLVTGACLAEIGHEVLCIDIDEKKIEKLRQSIIPIYEPGLEAMVKKNIDLNRLKFSSDLASGVTFADIQMIAVNTPTVEGVGADISNVLSVAKTIASNMQSYKLIINKSTAPPGTAYKIEAHAQSFLNQRESSLTFDVASNPEFLKEGSAVDDFLKPDRIVIGLNLKSKLNSKSTENPQKILQELYKPFRDKLLFIDIKSAELSKYASNAMLATKISFINELANIAEKIGADITDVREAMSRDPRIGPHFINAGCGYGGSCFPKDVKALAHFAKEYAIDPSLLDAVEAVNDRQKERLAEKALAYFKDESGKGDLAGKTFAIWGLAFKPNTNDMREASSRRLLERLWKEGAVTQVYDPIAMSEARAIYIDHLNQGKLTFCENAFEALEGADALFIVTEWSEFKNLAAGDLSEIKKRLKNAVIFDGRNIFDLTQVHQAGFDYYGIGRCGI